MSIYREHHGQPETRTAAPWVRPTHHAFAFACGLALASAVALVLLSESSDARTPAGVVVVALVVAWASRRVLGRPFPGARIVAWVAAALPICALVLPAAGCSDLQPAIHATNVTRRTGHELAAIVDRECTKPYEAAAQMGEAEAAAEVKRLDAKGCVHALHAQTALSEAHAAQVTLLKAYMAGECVATIARDVPPKCSLLETGAKLVDAGAELHAAVERLEASR